MVGDALESIRALLDAGADPTLQTAKQVGDTQYAYAEPRFPHDLLADETGAPATDETCRAMRSERKLSRCGKCKWVFYCNATCQRRAWPAHKKACGKAVESLCEAVRQFQGPVEVHHHAAMAQQNGADDAARDDGANLCVQHVLQGGPL